MRSAIYVCRNWPYFARSGGSRGEIMSAIKIVIIALGLAAGSLFGASAGQASGDAAWCGHQSRHGRRLLGFRSKNACRM